MNKVGENEIRPPDKAGENEEILQTVQAASADRFCAGLKKKKRSNQVVPKTMWLEV